MSMPTDVYNLLVNKAASGSFVAWYPFCEDEITSGYTPNVADQTDGSTLRLSLLSFVTGEYVGGGLFHIIDQTGSGYIISAVNPSVQISGDLSIILSHKPIIETVQPNVLLGCFANGETSAANVQYWIQRNISGALNAQHEYGSGINVSVNLGVSIIIDDTFQFIAVRRDVTLKQYEAKVNNGGFINTSYATNPAGGSNTYFSVATNALGVNQSDGDYKYVMIFNEKLTDEEVEIIRSAGDPSADWFDYSNWNSTTGEGYVTWVNGVADFCGTPLIGRAPLTVQFTDLSTGTPTSWSWTFGDGNTSSSQNPSNIYTKPGRYTVQLTAYYGTASDTESKTFYVTVNAITFRKDTDEYYFGEIESFNYANNSGIQYYSELLSNPKYLINERDIPSTELRWEISNIDKTERDLIYTLWNTTFQRGNYFYTICDHRKRYLFDAIWLQWKETWKKQRGGIYSITFDILSPFAWTPPTFAFYNFLSSNESGYGCHSLYYDNKLTAGTGGSITDRVLILTEQASAANAAYSTGISWFQQKDCSSLSLLAQFRCGDISAGATIDIIKISDGSNKIRLYATTSDYSSSVGLSSSQGLSSSSSQGLSSSIGLSSSSSIGLSSSSGNLSSSSIGLSSSSSQGLSSSSSSLGLSSSSIAGESSRGISSSQGLSSSSSQGLSSSIGLSSSSSQGLSSSSMGISSSLGLSSSSSQGISSSSSQGLSSSAGYSSSSAGLSSSSSSSQGYRSSSSSVGVSSSSSQSVSGAYSSQSTSSSHSSKGLSSSSSMGVSSSSGGLSSSSVEGSTEMHIVFEWTKSGSAAEEIKVENINNYSSGVRAWYDICGTFDNINNQFHIYICRAGDTSKAWSYTMDFLYNTTSLTSNPENSITSDLTPTNYPEDITWTSIYLLNSNQADIYDVAADKAELKYAMVIDEFVPPTEFNWFRKLFHYWNKSSGALPA